MRPAAIMEAVAAELPFTSIDLFLTYYRVVYLFWNMGR